MENGGVDGGGSPPHPPPLPAPDADTPVAIVTGANSGIGLAVTVALARAGHAVYAAMRPTASADALLAAAAAADAGVAPPAAVHVVRMDVGDDRSVAAAVAAVLAATRDRVDVAVANAGYGARVNIEGVPLSDYTGMMNVNFFGAVRLARAVVPPMRRRGTGRVLGVSSVAGVVGFPFMGAYVASKFAMEGFWESCYAEYKAAGVHFILIEPGPVATPMMTRARPPNPWALPPELHPIWDAFTAGPLRAYFADMQTADAVAAAIVRAVTDAPPALRYSTHAASEGLLRSKVADVDGRGVAAAVLSWVAAEAPAGGSTAAPVDGARPAK